MSTSADAFFHRRTTHQWISELAKVKAVTIYAGLGATIDRTGLSWERLMDQLLSNFVPDVTTRAAILDRYSPTQVATVLDGYYSGRPAAGTASKISRLREDMRDVLYGPNQVLGGLYSQSIAELAVELALAGKSVAIATPNYEEYLYLDLRDMLDAANLKAESAVEIDFRRYVVTGDEQDQDQLPAGWDGPGVISFVYLHGLVSQEPDKDQGDPVLSENDYANTGDRTRHVLAGLFRDRDVIVVGSSLTDAPLVNALIDTNVDAGNDRPLRVAVIPGDKPITLVTSGKEFREWRDQRFAQMGITAIYPDFYIQAGQLVHEVQRCVKFGDGPDMLKAYSPRRYGSRLIGWWAEWERGNISRQAEHHKILAKHLKRIREYLSIPIDENLKLEAWVRWRPASERSLALWASSTGTWAEPYLMRHDTITQTSRYAAVQVFANGAPKFVYEDPAVDSRWRSYFGVPVWHDTPEGRVPVGVVALSSMRTEGYIHHSNIRKLDVALVQMKEAGRAILEPIAVEIDSGVSDVVGSADA